jgi:hypothetical protein
LKIQKICPLKKIPLVFAEALNVPQHIFRAQTFALTFAPPADSKLFAGVFFYANICITGALKSD